MSLSSINMKDTVKNELFSARENAFTKEHLSDENFANIQANLFALLADQTTRYTMGDSSSVPVETAQELYASICFSIDLYLQSSRRSLKALINEDARQMLKAAWAEIEAQIKKGKALLKKVSLLPPKAVTISYEDTIRELKKFFRQYDYRFFAHAVPCAIDYQLSFPVDEDLKGILYINEYLRRLYIENSFCSYFNHRLIDALLRSISPDYRQLLINIYEPAAANAIGLAMLQGDILALDISQAQRDILLHCFHKFSSEEAKTKLIQAANTLCAFLPIKDACAQQYLQTSALHLYPRIQGALSQKGFENIFLTLADSTAQTDIDIFIDNTPMEDEKLRALIDEISSLRHTCDKIAMIKKHISSIRDTVEVLGSCFWEQECLLLFDLFAKNELALLKNFIDNQNENYASQTGWENELKRYLSSKEKK